MNEKFVAFLNDVPVNIQGFVLNLDNELTKRGSKCEIKTAKSGFVTSYSNPNTGKALLNYVFRKTGVKMRVYPVGIAQYQEILNEFSAKMKAEIIKAGDCKKLNGQPCCSNCPAGFAFIMDGTEYKKCRNMAFFHDLTEESCSYIQKLIEAELES